MTKTVELPFYGFYGFDATPFRYFFLKEDSENIEKYKKDILKVLKYEVLHDILPKHKSGNSAYDSEHLRTPSQKIALDSNKMALFYSESIQGIRGGELVVTYELVGDKEIKLNIYDRNTKVDMVGQDGKELEYAVCDGITQSELTIKPGKKIHPSDIHICSSLMGKEYSYEGAIKVFEEVKSKLDYHMDDPRAHMSEVKQEKTNENNR